MISINDNLFVSYMTGDDEFRKALKPFLVAGMTALSEHKNINLDETFWNKVFEEIVKEYEKANGISTDNK